MGNGCMVQRIAVDVGVKSSRRVRRGDCSR